VLLASWLTATPRVHHTSPRSIMPTNRRKDKHPPLPLEDLRAWIPSPEAYQWLADGDAKAAAFRAELDDAGADQIANLFSGGDDSDEDDSSSADSDGSEADYEGLDGRVLVWTSSRSNRDGVGEKYRGVPRAAEEEEETDGEEGRGEGRVRVVYVKSDSWEGYGEMLWASARHLANLFADPVRCRDLLQPLLLRTSSSGEEDRPSEEAKEEEEDCGRRRRHHPLTGLRVVELGAGCGVPSLMAMKCGARVVCTDLDDPNRIRSIAESMELNWRELSEADRDRYPHFSRSRACPFRWGESSQPVAKALNEDGTERFDVVIATDCLFIIDLHYALLAGIDELLARDGVAIIAFAIHEAYSKDEDVWRFVDKAKEKGFEVEVLEAVQMTPPIKGMDLKQGLIHKLRLTRSTV